MESGDSTGCPIQRKGGRSRIRSVPGTIEAGFGTDRLTCRNRRVVRKVGDGHYAPGLGVVPVPDLRDGLPVGEGEL